MTLGTWTQAHGVSIIGFQKQRVYLIGFLHHCVAHPRMQSSARGVSLPIAAHSHAYCLECRATVVACHRSRQVPQGTTLTTADRLSPPWLRRRAALAAAGGWTEATTPARRSARSPLHCKSSLCCLSMVVP
eukprot:COSAG02_NODE_1102_length_14571_cov_27.965243_7_plen_131_part_00